MAKKPFMPTTDLGKQQWLQNFAGKLPNYAAKYNIAALEVTDMTNSNLYWSYWLTGKNQTEDYNKKFTGFKNELRDGMPAGASPSLVPEPPDLGVAPTAVLPGIFVRAASIANVIKSKSNYTIADGQDLGIEGAEDNSEPEDMKPVLKIRLVEGGKPEVMWKKLMMDGIELFVDRGNGVFIFLATDTIPNYIDNHTLPAAGQTAIWKYKSIYRKDDTQVGEWSDVVSVTVTGV